LSKEAAAAFSPNALISLVACSEIMLCGWLRLVVIHNLHFFNWSFWCLNRHSFLDVDNDPVLGLLLLKLKVATSRTAHDDYDNYEKNHCQDLEDIDWF